VHAVGLPQAVGDALDLVTLARMFLAVGKGSQQADGEDGLVFDGGHGGSWGLSGDVVGQVRVPHSLKVPVAVNGSWSTRQGV
jgi:hypothetical protein